MQRVQFFGQSTEAHERADAINAVNAADGAPVTARVIGVDRRGYIIDFYEDDQVYQGTLHRDGTVRSRTGVLS